MPGEARSQCQGSLASGGRGLRPGPAHIPAEVQFSPFLCREHFTLLACFSVPPGNFQMFRDVSDGLLPSLASLHCFGLFLFSSTIP